jgi:hypothetical protein
MANQLFRSGDNRRSIKMSPYTTADLSPLPKEPLACALPYDLTWQDIQLALPGFDFQAWPQAQAFAAHEKQGLNGGDNSCILKIQYPTSKNHFRTETIFFKQNADPNKAEAQKYQYITSQGVETPRLLAVVQKDAVEVILLEFLPTIGIDFRSSGEITSLLHLIAKLNSIQYPPDLFRPFPGMPKEQFDAMVLDMLVAMERDQSLGSIKSSRWFDAYRVAEEVTALMPVAVNHNELFFQQVGWARRKTSPQLVIFDLETMAECPRFTDISTILYPLSVNTGRDQIELFQIYLERLNNLTHCELPTAEAFRELRFLRIAQSCYSLPWLVGEAKCLSSLAKHEDLHMMTNCMWDDMNDLGLI